MADIKEVAKQTIKTIDKVSIAQEKIKDIGIKTKESIKENIDANSESPSEYATNKTENVISTAATTAIYEYNKVGKRSFENTKQDIKTLKNRMVEKKNQPKKDDKYVIKFSDNIESKTVDKAVETGKQIKTAKKSEKTAREIKQKLVMKRDFAKQSAKSVKKTEEIARESAKEASKFAKKGFETLVKIVKASTNAVKSLVSAVIAGGWVSVMIIIVLCLVGAIAGSMYGIFYSGEDNGAGSNIRTVVQEMNAEFDNQVNAVKTSGSYDSVEINGTKANWKDVLAVFAVKTTSDVANPQEVVVMDDTKKGLLSTIFWDMNKISSKTENRTETRKIKTTDEQGNVITTTEDVVISVLVITIESKTAIDMTAEYSFTNMQKEYLNELLDDSNNLLWNSLIYNVGISGGIDIGDMNFDNETVNEQQKKIVAVATKYADYGILASSGYCQAWVADVYQVVTGSRGSAHCALCAADMWAVSSDFSQIPVGATVYGYASNPFGHVGIYIGNGQVIHNLSGTVKVQSLENWVKDFKGFAWGWENGNHFK